MKKNITDLDIQAFVDNELNEDDQKRVKTFILENRPAGERYLELSEQKELLKGWWTKTSDH